MTDGTVHSRKGPQNFSFYLCGGLNVIAGHLLLFLISVWEKKSCHTHPQMKAQYKAASQQNWKVSTNWENCWFQLLKAHTSCLSRVLIWFILQQINLAMQGSGLAAVSQWPMTLLHPVGNNSLKKTWAAQCGTVTACTEQSTQVPPAICLGWFPEATWGKATRGPKMLNLVRTQAQCAVLADNLKRSLVF